jgi:hypothetical protein
LGLGDGGDSQVELAGSVVGSGAEVDEVGYWGATEQRSSTRATQA